jgi:hypothetical protein
VLLLKDNKDLSSNSKETFAGILELLKIEKVLTTSPVSSCKNKLTVALLSTLVLVIIIDLISLALLPRWISLVVTADDPSIL